MKMEIILQHGNYQKLESFQNSVLIYDATVDFCARFLQKGDRTIDQMIQAARSGKQNIVEGCSASGISSETEIKLIGVARASLEELLEDYRDYLRTHHLALWEKDDPKTLHLRALAKQKDRTHKTYKTYLAADDQELICNLLISLIHQTNFLLDRQLKTLEKQFLERGGLRERMFAARQTARMAKKQNCNGDFAHELAILRKIYKMISAVKNLQEKAEVLQQIEKVAQKLKSREAK